MLPYTPLHHLLLGDLGGPLVMTSGNLSDEPIAVTDDDARERLSPIADAVLGHDRPIHRRCEDSVVRASFPLRRSRGMAPAALPLPVSAERPLVAAGAELKSTFCVARGAEAFLSPHLGDLDSAAAHAAFQADMALWRCSGSAPKSSPTTCTPITLDPMGAGPGGRAGRGSASPRARGRLPCRARRGGAGAGARLRRHRLRRRRHNLGRRAVAVRPGRVRADRPPGGRAAAGRAGRDPRALAHGRRLPGTRRAPGPVPEVGAVRESLKVNAPLSSGMGRLFDAVAALLGLSAQVSYEGRARSSSSISPAKLPRRRTRAGSRQA